MSINALCQFLSGTTHAEKSQIVIHNAKRFLLSLLGNVRDHIRNEKGIILRYIATALNGAFQTNKANDIRKKHTARPILDWRWGIFSPAQTADTPAQNLHRDLDHEAV